MDWSLLLLLACPLMMIIMMFGMKGMHGQGSHSNQDFQKELNELKVQNEQIKQEIQKLSQ